jgi:transposase
MGYLEQIGIPLFDHPPNSPDLNPIEKVWGEMKRRMREKNLFF